MNVALGTAATVLIVAAIIVGLVCAFAWALNPAMYRLELRYARKVGDDAWAAHCERKLGIEREAEPAPIFPLAMARARREHRRAAL